MIYLTGDIHGRLEVNRVVDFFERECLLRELSVQDFLIILGDVGLCWDGGVQDKEVKAQLESLSVTVLWIDGNHENFDLIDAAPVSEWHGGKVQFFGEKIIHLMRGYVFDIEGKKFFAFGGGHSIDKAYRTEGISWWKREMPSEEEYVCGKENIKKASYQVDYIITHTVPKEIAYRLVPKIYPGEEELQEYFQEIAEDVSFKKWYFGHWHMDCEIGNYVGLYEDIICLE